MTIVALLLFLVTLIINNTISQLVDCKDNICTCPNKSGQTCTLDCDITDVCKESTLNCRANDPCQIQCTETTACSAGTTINAATATDVTIICEKKDSCIDSMHVMCGIGHCELQCNHEEACIDWGYINVSLSLSFHCIGHCPKNIPSQFNSTTFKPTITNIITSNPPTMAPFDDHIINKNEIYAKDEHSTNNEIFGIIVAMIIGLCIACVITLYLRRKLKQKREKRIQKKLKHKPTISKSTLISEYIESSKSELFHKSPSMDLIVNSDETPIRASILSIKDITNKGIINNETETEMEQSTFTIDTILGNSGHHNTDSVSLCLPSINQSESGIDYNDCKCINSSESIVKQNGTPPGLPAIPDHKSVNQCLNHLMVENMTLLDNECESGEDHCDEMFIINHNMTI